MNVYWVLGMRPEAVYSLMSVPVTVSVVLAEVEVGPKVTLYPIISLFLSIQATRSHWMVIVLGVGVAIRFCTLPGAVRGRAQSPCNVCVCVCVCAYVWTEWWLLKCWSHCYQHRSQPTHSENSHCILAGQEYQLQCLGNWDLRPQEMHCLFQGNLRHKRQQ